jgi:FkbH-like protein
MSTRHKITTPQELLSRLDYDISYPELIGIARRLDQIFSRWSEISDRIGLIQTRVALVGNHTLSFLQAPVAVYLAGRGIRADWFTGEFDNYQQELLDENSGLHKFKPQVLLLLLDHRAIHFWPEKGASKEDVRDIISKQVHEWEILWEKAHKGSNAAVIQTNIALPCERVFGNFEAKAPWSLSNYLRELNRITAERTPSYVGICDAEYLSGYLGTQAWFDEPAWYNAGQGFGFQALSLLSRDLASMVAGLLGKSKKCLVLDLDNTLWGGVIGDAGVEGISLGRGNPVGEAFVDFQAYCKRLKERGVLLAVSSKNNDEIAKTPFESHPEMVLKLEDFSAFMVNWNDKATNIKKIASDLNLGLDSFVFVDDNPAERALVRQFLPEVAVPELPDDPALFRRAIDHRNYFETWSLTSEDLARTGYYAADSKRKEAAANIIDLPDFLRSLQQVCTMGKFDDINLQRTVQLTNKTNQWNLTTLRMTEGEVRQRMSDPAWFTLWVRHRDKFGDSGLIALLIARQTGEIMEIENWLMSCRVINRGVEDCVFEELLGEVRGRGVKVLRGIYRPTAKNAMVADLYAELGFQCKAKGEDGTTIWELEISEKVKLRPHYLSREQLQNNSAEDKKEEKI